MDRAPSCRRVTSRRKKDRELRHPVIGRILCPAWRKGKGARPTRETFLRAEYLAPDKVSLVVRSPARRPAVQGIGEARWSGTIAVCYSSGTLSCSHLKSARSSGSTAGALKVNGLAQRQR